MNTYEMFEDSKKKKTNTTYCSETYCTDGLYFNRDNLFMYKSGEIIDEINMNNIMKIKDWKEVNIMTIREVEKKFNIKVIGYF